jgi:hypothetical protein
MFAGELFTVLPSTFWPVSLAAFITRWRGTPRPFRDHFPWGAFDG